MTTRALFRPVISPLVRRVAALAHAMGRIVRPGDYLLDESKNYLTDELGNKLTG